MSANKYFTNSIFWTTFSKVADAILRFISIPFLINYFGTTNFGLLSIVISANAYMQLLDLGLNIGAVKFFSQWIANKNFKELKNVTQSSLFFYLILGLVNALILIMLAYKGNNLFNVEPEQYEILKSLFQILSAFTIISWCGAVFTQLLIAAELISYIQIVNLFRALANFIAILIAVYLKLDLLTYFTITLLITILSIIPLILKLKKADYLGSILPKFNWNSFRPVLKYSFSIFLLSFFQFTATQSRPLVLSVISTSATELVAKYKIIEVFPLFVVSLGGMLITIFLPRASKLTLNNDLEGIKHLAYTGTKYTSIFVCLLCFPIIINSKELLFLYVGESYSMLANWLILWIITIILFLHNSPIASLVLAQGKTKMLVIGTALACVISIGVNILLVERFGIGSAIIGYLVYITIVMLFYYFYFINKVLRLNSKIVFKSFLLPTLIGAILACLSDLISFNNSLIVVEIVAKSSIWLLLFFISLLIFRIIRIRDIMRYLNNFGLILK